jgi:beta-apo-4'-carotenal oxygenase
MNDSTWMVNIVPRFAKDEAVTDIPWTNMPLRPRIKKDPLGAALIIGYARG